MFTLQFLQIVLYSIIYSVVPQHFIKCSEGLLGSNLFDDKRFIVWVKFLCGHICYFLKSFLETVPSVVEV